ncbi:MAG: hypothetical protein ACN6OU_14490 [Stenotrophomonas acidaminiphila]
MSQVSDFAGKNAVDFLRPACTFSSPTNGDSDMVSRHKVESKHYVEEVIQYAIKNRKSFFEMEKWGARDIPDKALYAYFIERIKAVLH